MSAPDYTFWCESIEAKTGVPMDPTSRTDRTIAAIYKDVINRRGWRQGWEAFSAEAQANIILAWREAIESAGKGAS